MSIKFVLFSVLGACLCTNLAIANTYADSYKVKGDKYHPYATVKKGFTQIGTASWYDVATNFGVATASGEKLDENELTAASPVLPMNTKVKVTNLKNHKSVIVRVNDRGPYKSDHGPYKSKRILDLTKAAADVLGYLDVGTTKVRATVI